MDVDVFANADDVDVVHVELSARNLEQLAESKYLRRKVEGGQILVVTVRNDQEHYAGRPDAVREAYGLS